MNRLARLFDHGRFRLSLLPERLTRLRYFRGHGVHSPFVYAIVRQVFMRSSLDPKNEALYRRLREERVPHKGAVRLANLCAYCGCRQLSFAADGGGDCLIVPRNTAPTAFAAYVQAARNANGMLVILQPYLNRERAQACRTIAASHEGTSVDKFGFLLLFHNEKLPKQHYRI